MINRATAILEVVLASRPLQGSDYPARALQTYSFYPDGTVSVLLEVATNEVVIYQAVLGRARVYGNMILAGRGADKLMDWFTSLSGLELYRLVQRAERQGVSN